MQLNIKGQGLSRASELAASPCGPHTWTFPNHLLDKTLTADQPLLHIIPYTRHSVFYSSGDVLTALPPFHTGLDVYAISALGHKQCMNVPGMSGTVLALSPVMNLPLTLQIYVCKAHFLIP